MMTPEIVIFSWVEMTGIAPQPFHGNGSISRGLSRAAIRMTGAIKDHLFIHCKDAPISTTLNINNHRETIKINPRMMPWCRNNGAVKNQNTLEANKGKYSQ